MTAPYTWNIDLSDHLNESTDFVFFFNHHDYSIKKERNSFIETNKQITVYYFRLQTNVKHIFQDIVRFDRKLRQLYPFEYDAILPTMSIQTRKSIFSIS